MPLHCRREPERRKAAHCLSAERTVLPAARDAAGSRAESRTLIRRAVRHRAGRRPMPLRRLEEQDRKSTRLNSSHLGISYAVFCLKKKKKEECDINEREIHTSHL